MREIELMKTSLTSEVYLEIEKYQKNIFEIIDDIKHFILTEECPFLIIDIAKLNMIDAAKTGILCSTFHFAKYPDGNITWEVSDLETQRTIKFLKLRNTYIKIKSETEENQIFYTKLNRKENTAHFVSDNLYNFALPL